MTDRESDTFFVMGFPKSGTTWVQLLLDAHPQIACRGEDEFAFFDKEVNGLLERYNKILHVIQERTAQRSPTLFDNGDKRKLLRFTILLALDKGRAAPGIKCIGTKDNGMVRKLSGYAKLFPVSKFVFVVRDPRDAAVSGWFHSARVDRKHLDAYPNLAIWAKHIALSWQKDAGDVLEAAKTMKDRFVSIRYEDLHADPVATTARLLDFLAVDSGEAAIQACLEATRFTALAGGREPGAEDRRSFFRKGIVGDWKHHIDDETAAWIANEAGATLRRFGYD